MATEFYRQGLAAYRAGNPKAGVYYFSQSLELDTTQYQAYDGRAGCYELLGQIKPAVMDSREVTRLLPDSYRGFWRAAKLLIKVERFDQARKMLVEALGKSNVSTELLETMRKTLNELDESIRIAKLSPISSIPVDIFVLIVSLVSPSTPVLIWASAAKNKSQKNPAITLSHVCRSWRKAIHASAILWDTLTVNGNASSIELSAKVKLWGKNSVGRGRRGRGLTRIEVYNSGGFTSERYDQFLRILETEDCCKSLKDFGMWAGGSAEAHISDDVLLVKTVRALKEWAKGILTLKSFIYNALVPMQLDQAVADLVRSSPDLGVFICRGVSAGGYARPAIRANPSARRELVTKITHLELNTTGGQYIDELWSHPLLMTLKMDYAMTPRFEEVDYNSELSELHLNHHLIPSPASKTALVKLTALKVISIQDSPEMGRIFLNAGCEGLMNLALLTSIDLTGTQLVILDLTIFASISTPALLSLNLSKTTLPVDFNPAIWPSCLELLNLNLSSTAYAGASLVESFGFKLPKLERLNLSGTGTFGRVGHRGITGGSLIKLVQARRGGIKELNLNGLDAVGKEELKWLKTQVTSVQWSAGEVYAPVNYGALPPRAGGVGGFGRTRAGIRRR